VERRENPDALVGDVFLTDDSLDKYDQDPQYLLSFRPSSDPCHFDQAKRVEKSVCTVLSQVVHLLKR
jgi:hypothetical protein